MIIRFFSFCKSFINSFICLNGQVKKVNVEKTRVFSLPAINEWAVKGVLGAFIVCGLCVNSSVQAQHRFDLGAFLGTSYYLGDLNRGGHFRNAHPALGALLRYNFSYRWALKGAVTMGSISGDYPSKNIVLNEENLETTSEPYEFKRTMVDFAGMIEFNFLPFDQPFVKHTDFTPYITTGLAASQYSRYESDSDDDNGKSVFLLSLPFGLGVKYKVTDWMRIGAEWTLRKTFVDDLDKTSNNASVDPSDPYGFNESTTDHNNDWYSFAGVTVSFSMFERKTSCSAGYKKF